MSEKNTREIPVFFLRDKVFQAFGNDLDIGAILIDLQKTFSRIDHNIHLIKSSLVGFVNHTLDGFNFTLKMFVKCGNLILDFSSISGKLLQNGLYEIKANFHVFITCV